MNETASDADLATIEPVLRTALEVADELLVEAARRGDDDAFEQIFERHRRRVARMIGRLFTRPRSKF